MLDWSSEGGFSCGQLLEQAAWYRRVLDSGGVQPPTETTMLPERLPERFRQHLVRARRLYDDLLDEYAGK